MYLQVESGNARGQTFCLDQPVMRLGSDATCQIPLPVSEVAPHALTIESRGDDVRIYNRLPEAIQLDGQEFSSGGTANWALGQTLELPGGLRASLVEQEPAALEQTDAIDDDYEPYPEEAAPEKKAKSSGLGGKSGQYAVIGGCVVITLACLLGGSGSAESEGKQSLSFSQIVTTAVEDEAVPTKLVQRFQFAEAGVVRGDLDAAGERFRELRDVLLKRQEQLGDDLSDSERSFLSYVERRLERL